jgi:hypothetical protein
LGERRRRRRLGIAVSPAFGICSTRWQDLPIRANPELRLNLHPSVGFCSERLQSPSETAASFDGSIVCLDVDAQPVSINAPTIIVSAGPNFLAM